MLIGLNNTEVKQRISRYLQESLQNKEQQLSVPRLWLVLLALHVLVDITFIPLIYDRLAPLAG